MNVRPSILCPIDFSGSSRGALRYAAAVASHFATRLIVLTVKEPVVGSAPDFATGVPWNPDEAKREMRQFAAQTFGTGSPTLATLEYDVAVGKPPSEILRVAQEHACELIVMSTHGLTGMWKLCFGSTTERVLRETTRPVLVTPPHDPGPVGLEVVRESIRRIMLPVDLSPVSLHQAQVASGLAEALTLPLIVVHVIEPSKSRWQSTGVEADRRTVAEKGLSEILATLPRHVQAEALVVEGDPAKELAKIACDRQAGLVVMGLHDSPLLGPRMGSVTYRLLCLAPTLVLALPPKVASEPVTRATVGGTLSVGEQT